MFLQKISKVIHRLFITKILMLNPYLCKNIKKILYIYEFQNIEHERNLTTTEYSKK